MFIARVHIKYCFGMEKRKRFNVVGYVLHVGDEGNHLIIAGQDECVRGKGPATNIPYLYHTNGQNRGISNDRYHFLILYECGITSQSSSSSSSVRAKFLCNRCSPIAKLHSAPSAVMPNVVHHTAVSACASQSVLTHRRPSHTQNSAFVARQRMS